MKERVVNVAIVGTGGIWNTHANDLTLRSDNKIVTICEISEAHSREVMDVTPSRVGSHRHLATHQMNTTLAPSAAGQRIAWYRTPLTREQLAQLNAKSDAKGFAQSLGHLGLMVLTAVTTLYGAAHGLWWLFGVALFLHGTVAAFTMNAMHELVHRSVFRTQALNQFFVRIFCFISWIHYEHFYNSHMRHHQYTLHPPDDQEVVLPLRVMTKQFFLTGFINPCAFKYYVMSAVRLARGRFEPGWEEMLYPADQPEKAAPVIRWARVVLIGHALILLISVSLAWLVSPVWLLVPVLTSHTGLYGSWLFFLCNNTQHIGLQDNVNDFRLSCRTFTVNPLVRFLYWHMNYHTEHHMYAAVPCYNLARLHRSIKHDLPPCPAGLIATWKEIAAIQRLQAADPAYQHAAHLPLRPESLLTGTRG